jgi:hypothetical protein
MDRDQGRRHLAEANRHIAQVKHYIARQSNKKSGEIAAGSLERRFARL